MRTPKCTFLALASLALLPLAACQDIFGPDRRQVGEMHFTYSGAVNGEFDAEGSMTLGNFRTGTFAYAQRGTDGNGNETLIIYAQEGRSNGDKYDGLFLALENTAERTVTCVESNPDCPLFSSFILGQDDTSTGEAEAMFVGTAGQLTITEMDDDRVRGTFTLSMTALDVDGGVEVRSGTFDLPVTDEALFSPAKSGVFER